MIVSPHEQSALDEFALLRENLPPRLRVVIDALADEHVQLLRLCNGTRERPNDEEERTE